MKDKISVLQERITGVIYNPFINLKDLIRELKKLIDDSAIHKELIVKLDAALVFLDEYESLPYGNLERIKGFNKIKSQVLRVIRELQADQ